MALDATRERTQKEDREKDEELFSAFPHLKVSDLEEVEEVVEEILYLYKPNVDIWTIYSMLKNFLSDNYIIDSNLLLRLIDSEKLDLVNTLKKIPYIHSSYVETITPKGSSDGS